MEDLCDVRDLVRAGEGVQVVEIGRESRELQLHAWLVIGTKVAQRE